MFGMLQYEMNEVHPMKKRLYMLMFIFLFFALIACQPKSEEELQKYIDLIEIGYQNTDTEDEVTEDLELIGKLDDVMISWSSSHPSIIDEDGNVTRPDVDTEVTLTATLTLKDATETVTFIVIVKAIPVVVDPLETALTNMNSLQNYTMTMTFETDDESYTVLVKMGELAASVEALDETIYYEVDDDVCYIYEYSEGSWVKSEVECSEKGTSELSFLTGFSKDFFVKQTAGEVTTYQLKTEHYQSLQSFLNSSSTSNFRMTLENNYIKTIWLTMTRDDITFDVTIVISAFNQTSVTLPVILS